MEYSGTVNIGGQAVNRIGLGTNRISNNKQSRAVLKRAVELGVNFIDTAKLYGQSQLIIGETLSPYPKGLVVSTKGGFYSNNLKELQASIDESLRLLKLEQLPHYFLHRVYEQDQPLEETVHFLKKQVQAGKILNIGLSDVNVEQIERARKIMPITSVQNRYNILERHHEEVLEFCEREGIIFTPFFPLGSGRVEQDSRLAEIVGKYKASPIEIALAWLLKRSPVMLPIPGTLSIEHLQSNLAAAKIELSDEDFKYLDAQSL